MRGAAALSVTRRLSQLRISARAAEGWSLVAFWVNLDFAGAWELLLCFFFPRVVFFLGPLRPRSWDVRPFCCDLSDEERNVPVLGCNYFEAWLDCLLAAGVCSHLS